MKKSSIIAVTIVLTTVLFIIACHKWQPLGLIHTHSGYLPPEFGYEKEPVSIDVLVDEMGLEIEGDAEIERLDSHRVRLTSQTGNLAISLKDGEAIYGLTERTVDDREQSETRPAEIGGLDRRSQMITMWIKPTISAYVPFYISSRGYGMLVEGTWPGIYDIGKTSPDVLKLKFYSGEEGFSCVFFFGESYTDILDRYTEFTGRPFLPPRWVFLPLKWRDQVGKYKFEDLDGVTMNAEVVDDITMFEELDFPKGIYMIDRPWAEGFMGYGNYSWDPYRFPNGDRMVEVLHERGWRVIVWGAPWALGTGKDHFGPEARKKGYLIGDRTIDYTNPEARLWHVEKISQFVRRSKIDGWKLDRSEEWNPSTTEDIYHDGRSGIEVHNDYPRMYIKTYYDGTRKVRGDDFVLVPRAAYTGTQAWSIVWGGDTKAHVDRDTSTDLGLRSTIISLQQMAFMGFPVWGSDTGGYSVFTDREVFARWLEFSAFCPLMEIGGSDSHEPWAMPTEPSYDEEMIRIFRRYTWIHARLADYSHSLAVKAHRTGDPIVHPLVFDWPDDEKVKDMWDEFMYGPALLVAPVWKTGTRSREVYLPAGEWESLWDPAEQYEGPVTVTVDTPMDIIPVFIKVDQKDLLPENLIEGL